MTLEGSEWFWGYFWGYDAIDYDTEPFKISRLRHLFDCLLSNPPGKACWNGLAIRRAVSMYIIIRLYKYLGMMGLSVGVNTHSNIKKGG